MSYREYCFDEITLAVNDEWSRAALRLTRDGWYEDGSAEEFLDATQLRALGEACLAEAERMNKAKGL